MNIEMTDLDMILNYLETTSLEPHDDYISEFTYKDQKILYKHIKELQQENQQLKEQINEYKRLGFKHLQDKNNKLENNWNELKKWLYEDEFLHIEEVSINSPLKRVLNKIVELERGIGNE